MRKNDVLQCGDRRLRVLAISGDRYLCIDCNGRTMPEWIPTAELEHYKVVALETPDAALTPDQLRIAHERFTLIAPVLSFLTDDKERCRMLDKVSEDNAVSKQTLRRYLCRYLAAQDIAVLAPAVRETKQDLTQDQKNMR